MKRHNNTDLKNVKPYISKRSKDSLKCTTNYKDDKKINLPVVNINSFKSIKNYIPKSAAITNKVHTKPITSLKWNLRDANIILSSSLDKSIVLLDGSSGCLLEKAKVNVHDEGIKDAIWTHGMESIITASFDKTSKLVDVETG